MAPASATESAKTPVHQTLSPEELRKVHAYWRAANYLSVGQIYLYANPLLREPLSLKHIKPRLLGHWGTTPGLNFIYLHLKRLIKQNDLDVIYIAGPGHGGPGLVANTYLEGTYSEFYSSIPQTEDGLRRLVRFTKAASSDTPLLTRMAPPSTIQICWSAASWGTAKRKPARWPPVGTPISF